MEGKKEKLALCSSEWMLCPICNNKTRIRARKDTVIINLPLYCPKCHKETLISVKQNRVEVITEPDV